MKRASGLPPPDVVRALRKPVGVKPTKEIEAILCAIADCFHDGDFYKMAENLRKLVREVVPPSAMTD